MQFPEWIEMAYERWHFNYYCRRGWIEAFFAWMFFDS